MVRNPSTGESRGFGFVALGARLMYAATNPAHAPCLCKRRVFLQAHANEIRALPLLSVDLIPSCLDA